MTELLQFAKSRRGGELIGIVIWAIGISLAFLLVAVLVLYGFQQRIGEYR